MHWPGLSLLAALAALAFGQSNVGPVPGVTDTYNHYQANRGDTSISSQTITIQQPVSPSYTVVFESLTVYCSAACTLTLSWSASTPATGTALATTALNNAPASQATAWRSSNASGGTTGAVYQIGSSGGTLVIDMSKYQLGINNGAKQNLSVALSASSITSQIGFQWIER